MTLTTDSTATATLSGRELALKRRKAMALHGKAGVTKTSSVMSARQAAPRMGSAPATHVASSAGRGSATAASASDADIMAKARAAVAASGKSASRARREAMSTAGKAALQPAASRPSGRVRQKPPMDAYVSSATAVEPAAQGCGCGCNGASGGCGDASDSAGVMPAAAVAYASNVSRKASEPTGRALARARRAALSQDGKAGLKRVAQATKIASSMPGQDWEAAITKGATGRQKAMQRRVVQSLAGSMKSARSGDATRPAGRVRARMETPAPAKVEAGQTLSGQGVTGTMVERSKKVTGNEPGSCRAVTGTEYIGADQYDTLCSARPAPAPAKVGVSHTMGERKVTGTEVGRAANVTGDEPGNCRGITGTEYLAAERFDEMCSSRPAPSPAKVALSDTARGKQVTGTSVNRSGTVTGNEAGSNRPVTGTDYSVPTLGAQAPDKVALSHTSHGKSVTGTAVGHTSRITGDENGNCRGITGTEYLAQEQFTTVCGTSAPETPRKVSVMSSRGQQPVSGTEVGRSRNVTGDEPGSCRSITGSQYYNSESFGALCDAASPKKVATMQTLSGRSLTGTEVGRSPKVSGDEMGGCKPVTGTEYIGADQQRAVCSVSTPVAPVAKVAVDQTWRGQAVTGTYVGRSERVTGAESGGCSPISGTPYIGRGQYNGFCEAPALQAQEARIRTTAVIPAAAVTGDRPGAGGSVMTGDERGACEVVSGTPYVGVDNTTTQCATSGRFVARGKSQIEMTRQPAPLDFSISTPARAAQQKQFSDVTGSACNSERITGPVNKAGGLITGTPEFRHRDATASQTVQADAIAAARRLTGEGSQAGRQVTGDAWDALSKVTGTEGASSMSRNPSARGNPRGMGMNAALFRDVVETPVVPDSRITGSSGNTGKGSLITLSGGARG
ncbi:MAG: carboxysome shell protein [Hydrogenophilales bacterium 17-61-9]|nr:MAG: carboxysome shell protein [Hydrogenophilales bacterium 17-61-9]